MACITKQHQGKYTYLYESVSYRDEQGRPRNHKTKIGKIDPKTGRTIYTEAYIERMREAGTPVHVSVFEGIDGLEERMAEALDSVRDYGLFYFLKSLAEKTGVLKTLQEAIPFYWKELCMMSFYLLASDKPLMNMDLWLSENEHFPVGKMDSRRISDLLLGFGQKERNEFYRAWCRKNVSEDYLALDITSISSYSNLIPDCEWGYNRDGENLPQVNVCLLYGEKTELPVYQTQYSGSLNDRVTFKTTIEEMKAISGGKRLVLVMDKGFYSEKNIKTLIAEGHSFLVSVPFNTLYAKTLIGEAREEIEAGKNMIKTTSNPIRGKTLKTNIGGTELTAHIFYNPEKELQDRNALYAHTTWLKENIEDGKTPSGFEEDIEKYLEVYDYVKGAIVTIRQDIIDRELETSGWMVIIGNENISAQSAHDIYRRKDVVEKAFLKFKTQLGMGRLRVHDAERMRNKSLVAFISLILISAIHKTMKTKNMYKTLTVDRLLMILSKLKLLVIDGHHILRPITKE